MTIKLGVVEYVRPTSSVCTDDIRQFLAVGGKDVIRLAWKSLTPDRDNLIKHDALGVWFCEFFNLRRNEGNGTKCIQILKDMDIISGNSSYIYPKFDV